jgi:hypothetical protein
VEGNRAAVDAVMRAMRARTNLLALPLLLVACTGAPGPSSAPTSGPTTAPTPTAASGIEALVIDLNRSGVQASVGSPFLGEPVGGEGTSLCIGTDTVQVYGFIDHEAALAASAKINRADPTQVGNAHVEWTGPPRFWLRDRIIVLYLGDDAATDAALRALLGPPFAESKDPGRGFLPNPPCS